jgi:hypothetical protein
MVHRTTLLLDEQSQRAARQIAAELECSVSEAIRRAIMGYRDQLKGVDASTRARRKRALVELVELFEGNDARAEIGRLKQEDEGF